MMEKNVTPKRRIQKRDSELIKDTRNSANNFVPQKFYAVIKSAINANLK
jgi:hypothetical protein